MEQDTVRGMNTGTGSYDQSNIKALEDVLVYTSAVLEEGLPDADFTVKLVNLDLHATSNYYRTRPAPSRGLELQLPAVEPQPKYWWQQLR